MNDALNQIAHRFIKWPRGQELEHVINNFQRLCDFPKVIGAIDGTHIEIRAPVFDKNSYKNRNKYYSINLQVISDTRRLFTHCFSGYPGSVHDARVLRNSNVARFLRAPDLYFPNDSHIIGDAAYGIHRNVMVPFRDNGYLTMRQKNYNHCLSVTRMIVERAIGLLKIRFRSLLDGLSLTDTEYIPTFIIACCVLHNICILENDELDVPQQNDNKNRNDIPNMYVKQVQAGNRKRNEIMRILPMKI